ncbi:MAG TPA: DUF3795 domain-containing protein [Acidobacteriota bacterium]|nr:DUF3795 domain-containing protein [Acidobacteriota bacterium]
MQKTSERYGICGVYCGQCPNGNGRVSMMAQELKRLVDTTRYEWLRHYVKSFNFDEFRKGLEWFSDSQCPMCLKGGGNPNCENRKCVTGKNLQGCLQCNEYMMCKNTVYQRETYPFVSENYRRAKEVGLKKHLDEEEERSRAGVSLMSHLERKYCKVVKLKENRK